MDSQEKISSFNEFLTEIPSVHLKEKVIRYLASSRSSEMKRSGSLINPGIYGRDWEALWDEEQQMIPLMHCLVDSLMKMDLGTTPIIFQQSSPKIVQELKRQLNSGFVLNFSQIQPVNVYALLYDFFAEMPSPLIPSTVAFDILHTIASNGNLETIKNLIKSLPKTNGIVLCGIVQGLLKLSPQQNFTLLSISWGPILFKDVNNESLLQDCTIRCKNINALKSTAFQLFLERFDFLF